jgi:hypothetical protein
VNFLVADCAVAKTGRAQIMECRRYNSDGAGGARSLLRQIGVALEADEADFGARQHLRIRRAMRFVASLAPIRPHRLVFIREWPTQIRMTLEAAGFVCRECANLPQEKTAVRVVAIRAGHRVLRQSVRVRPLECSPGTGVAAGTLLVHGLCRSYDQARWFRLMHPVAAGTGDAASGMPTLNAPDVSSLVAMAAKTGFVGAGGGQLHRVDDILR